jgi:hypothetical protein
LAGRVVWALRKGLARGHDNDSARAGGEARRIAGTEQAVGRPLLDGIAPGLHRAWEVCRIPCSGRRIACA